MLLAVTMLAGCNSEDDMTFSFDSDGEIIVNPISASEFNRSVLGCGWAEIERHDINADGTYNKKNHNNRDENEIGSGAPNRYEFSEGKVTTYWSGSMETGFFEAPMHYDEKTNKLYFGDNDLYKVLSVNNQEIKLVSRGGDSEMRYGWYVILRRLTDEELQHTKEVCWINDKDRYREMTWDDLMHKWILRCYIANGFQKEVPFDRDNDRISIQFFPDGTVKLKNYNDLFEGTFEYNGKDSIQLRPKEGTPEWGGLYFKAFPSIKKAVIRYAAGLTLSIDDINYYEFIRAKNDE
jgi:hypothetical protein